MQQIAVRVDEELRDELDAEADDRGVSRSEHVRRVLRERANTDRLRDRVDELEGVKAELARVEERLAAREAQVEDLEDRLAERDSRVQRLEERLKDREERIADLEEQLARRSQLEQKVDALPDRVREADSYAERRQRMIDEASLTQRLKWRVTGVPVDAIDEEGGR